MRLMPSMLVRLTPLMPLVRLVPRKVPVSGWETGREGAARHVPGSQGHEQAGDLAKPAKALRAERLLHYSS